MGKMQTPEDLKRKFISEISKKGAKRRKERGKPSHGKMCSTCAFKFDSPANLEPHNVESAFQCISFDQRFNCHINEYENAGKPCVGYLNAIELNK